MSYHNDIYPVLHQFTMLCQSCAEFSAHLVKGIIELVVVTRNTSGSFANVQNSSCFTVPAHSIAVTFKGLDWLMSSCPWALWKILRVFLLFLGDDTNLTGVIHSIC